MSVTCPRPGDDRSSAPAHLPDRLTRDGTFIGVHATVLVQHWLGPQGMVRRYADCLPTDGLDPLRAEAVAVRPPDDDGHAVVVNHRAGTVVLPAALVAT